MKTVLLRHIKKHVDEIINIKGWITHFRSSGKIAFIEVRDGTGVIQCVASIHDVGENQFDVINNLAIENSISVTGHVVEDKRSKIGHEIHVMSLSIIHSFKEEFPISPKEHGVAFLMDRRHLWLRSTRQVAIMKIRDTVCRSAREFLFNNDFIQFDAPVLTPNACEGTTTLFETKYFDDKAYLTQSGQLYAEAGALALGKVYCFGPTFRAEKSKTRRHLAEFWMIEPEAAFFDLEMDMDLAEKFVMSIVTKVLQYNRDDLLILDRDIGQLEKIQMPFPRISYDKALFLLKEKNINIEWGNDFGGDDETVLSEMFDSPVMIHRYPAQCKAFYMKNDPDNTQLSLCVDMLAPEGYGEIIGGGQREDDYELLLQKIDKHGLDTADFQWYLDLRKYGSVPHAGFGLGIERTVTWLCGLKHVRETIPFPRFMGRMAP